MNTYIETTCKNAKNSFYEFNKLEPERINNTLQSLIKDLLKNKSEIFKANRKDIKNAQLEKKDEAFLDRLHFGNKELNNTLISIEKIISLPNILGQITNMTFQPTGIKVGEMVVPIGVIFMIYESRPNVTIDSACLSIKSGNAIILRGGSESFFTNTLLYKSIRQSLKKNNLPPNLVQYLKSSNRDLINEILKKDEYVDLVIPRGGKNLIRSVINNSSIPVLKHLDGVCHLYIDSYANESMALKLTINSKTQRLSTCNTLETLLVHAQHKNSLLKKIGTQLKKKGIKIFGDKNVVKIVTSSKLATEEDWKTEYLGPMISIKVVQSLEEAINHINKYGSGHTDSIVTENITNSEKFIKEVDSSSVMVNTSTRFADGFEYGLGAEIGISTNKLHARGPVGLEGLTTKKWIVIGNGQIRE